MFSYGSGSAASMFSLTAIRDLSEMKGKMNFLRQISDRVKVAPENYDKIMNIREKSYGKKPLDFIINETYLRENTFVLDSIDDMYVRNYKLFVNGGIKDFVQPTNLQRLATINRHLTAEQQKSTKIPNMWNGFFNKTLGEKQSLLKLSYPDLQLDAFENGGLSVARANLMIENCIGKISLPVGLGYTLNKI